jgi:predicted MFS family arabinose efflux permease
VAEKFLFTPGWSQMYFYGRRRMLLAGLGLFGLASLAGGLAQAPGQLVAARAAQGIGAGGAFGVLLGGLLTQYASWRWVMFVNVPMAAVALVLAGRGVAADRPATRGGRPDILGAVLATAGVSLLVFGVVRTDQYSWGSPVTLITLAIAAALLAAFVYTERATAAEPLVRLGLFTNRSVAGANAYNLLVGAAMAAAFYFASFYLQRVLGTGPARTGAEFLPFALGVIAGSVLAVKLGYRFAARTLLIAGGLLTAAGFAWFGLISADGSFATDILGPSIVASVGFGLCLGPVVSTATAGVAPGETGTASGLLNSSRQIGASIGLAALATVAQHRTGHVATPQALNAGYALGLTLSAALLIAAVVIAATVLPRARPPARAGQAGDRDLVPVNPERNPA